MSKHMKRLVAPRSWGIPRKRSVWTTKQSPGPHPVERSVPLLLVVRDMLKLCDNAREAKHIIGARNVTVDGRVVIDHKFPVGFMDVVSIGRNGQDYRMLMDAHGRYRLTAIPPDEAKSKLVRVENKRAVRGGRFQLNMHDGRNLLLDKNQYTTGDVLKIELPTQKVLKALPFKEGSLALLIGGSHPGALVTIKSYEVKGGSAQNLVSFKEGFSTVENHVFVVGEKTPEIKLLEASAI